MKLSEGLLLAATFPLCRGRWVEGEAGCLLTALGKVVGVDINHVGRGVGSLRPHFPLLFQVASLPGKYMGVVVGVCIVAMFDHQHTADEIVAWVQELEAAQEAAQEEVHELQRS